MRFRILAALVLLAAASVAQTFRGAIQGTRSGFHATEVSQGVLNGQLTSTPLTTRTRLAAVQSLCAQPEPFATFGQ